MRFWPFQKKKALSVPVSPTTRGGWCGVIKEPFSGAWQRNIEWKRDSVLSYHAVFACITLIASDISKLRINVIRDVNGFWEKTSFGKYKFLEKPNSYQNRIQFFETWVNSKLIRGNAYILKKRDAARNVVELHVLHPDLVLPLVSEDGEVFYQIGQDNLSGIQNDTITVPASEIIHDRFNCFFHPLVGLSPLFASGLPAYSGLKNIENGANLYKNGSRPSGILTVPEAIDEERASQIKQSWEANYSGENYGKTAIIGGDVKYTALAMTAAESQMVETLRLTAEMVCSTFHVPAYKVIGNAPAYNNIEALEQAYYNQCLQVLIESIEECLDKGLDMPDARGFEFDLDGLLRMDTKSKIETLGQGVIRAIYSPNEARKQVGLKPVDGGEVPYLQEQNWPISELSKRKNEEEVAAEPDNSVNQMMELSYHLRKGFDA